MANGGTLACTTCIPDVVWSINGVAFQSPLKIIPLQTYDLILAMDWLEQFSPMKVHWADKWMAIPYQGSTVFLQGICNHEPSIMMLQVFSMAQESVVDKVELPQPVALLLEEFAYIF